MTMANRCCLSLFVAMLLVACSCSCFSEGRRDEWTALLQDEGQEAENPYVFEEGSFVTTVRCQAGQIRAVPNFRERPELPRGVEDCRIVDTSLQPNSILLPHFVDAELILCVVRGRGRIAYVQEERLVERELEEGDVYAIPAASTHYLVNTDDSQPLRIYSLLRPESSAGSYATFYVVGGRDPQSVLSAFSEAVLQAAFKCPRDVLDRMLISGYGKGAIISASNEGLRRLISGRIKGLEGSEDPNPFNLLYRKPDFSNNNGDIYQALATDYRLLRGLNVGVQLTNLTAGSMTAPNYNTRAIRIAIVINGQGRLEMAVPQRRTAQAQAQTYQRVQASLNRGTVYVVPAGYPSTEIASLNGELQILSFEINSRGNRREFLAGRNNVLRYLRNEIKQLTLQYSAEEIEGVLKAQNDQVLLRGPKRQGQADERTSSSLWSF